jgi:ribose transport system permease protein
VIDDNAGTSVEAPLHTPARRTVLSNLLFGTRFVTIWIAALALVVICRIVAPSTLSSASWSSLLPLGSVVAIVALGQMLVIMMGGIDLSMGANISLCANVLVGVSLGSNDRMLRAVVTVFVVAIVIGLVNGFLVAVFELNPLIVTLATSLCVLGINTEYRAGTTNSTTAPRVLSDFVFEKALGVSKTFWFVVVLTLLMGVII